MGSLWAGFDTPPLERHKPSRAALTAGPLVRPLNHAPSWIIVLAAATGSLGEVAPRTETTRPAATSASSREVPVPHTYDIRYRYKLTNRTDRPLQDVRVCIPIPQDCPYQKILSFALTLPGQPHTTEDVTDQFGQKIVRIGLDRLDPKASVETGFACRVRFRIGFKVPLEPKRVGTLNDVPPDIRSMYTSDLPGVYDLGSPEIRQVSAELAGPHQTPLDRVLAIHDFVASTLKYVRDGTWDSAPVVLRRQTGSCSEFSFLFCALCRAAGIPTRLVGGSTCRVRPGGPWPRKDDVHHRWTEVYIPPYEWVPFDVTRNRGRPPKRDHVGAHPAPALILSRSGGNSRLLKTQYVGWNTHAAFLERTREFIWSPVDQTDLTADPARD